MHVRCIFNDPYTCSPIDDSTTDIPICAAECCGKKEAPHHSQHEMVLLETKQKFGEKNGFRSFQVQWYKDYPWLTLCITTKKAFCFYCRLYYEQKELCLSKNIEPAFIRDGFSNWKKAIQ